MEEANDLNEVLTGFFLYSLFIYLTVFSIFILLNVDGYVLLLSNVLYFICSSFNKFNNYREEKEKKNLFLDIGGDEGDIFALKWKAHSSR